MSTPRPPKPAELMDLRPDDRRALTILAAAVLFTTAGVILSITGGWVVWTAGQLVLAFALVQWFALLHECGHETLFSRRRWHAPVGQVAAFFALIPYHCWTRVHRRHHKWTGWQDLDPTTAALAPRERGRIELTLVNLCWRCWVPIFAVVYRLSNYWNLPRLWAMFPQRRDRQAILRDSLWLAAAYAALVLAAGPAQVLRIAGLALLVAFTLEELLILSQHTHVPQGISGGAAVEAYASIEQEPFTRSLRLPGWISTLVLPLDAHELHHMYPFVPGYHLRRIPYQPEHEVGWWTWVVRARRLRGDVLLYANRLETGWDV